MQRSRLNTSGLNNEAAREDGITGREFHASHSLDKNQFA